jgi:hypothetical protein
MLGESTDSGQRSGSKLSTTAVRNELRRLEKAKSDKLYVDGELKVVNTKIGFIEKEQVELGKELSNIDHVCTHKSTIANMKTDVARISATVSSWDKTMRKGIITAVSTVILIASTVAGWFVWTSNIASDVETIQKERAQEEEERKKEEALGPALISIDNSLKEMSTAQSETAKALTELQSEKEEKKPKENRRRTTQ